MEDNTSKKMKLLIITLCIIFIIALPILLFLLFGKGGSNEELLDSNFVIKSIQAKSGGNYISNDETFVLKTTAANEEIVRKHLYIEPAVNYEIKKVSSEEYEVSVSNIPSDTLVNLSYVKDTVKSYSWAFQSTKELKVLSVYPKEGASTVSTGSGIRVTLSYPNVENFEENFEIEPKVDGVFEHVGRTWKFIPRETLKNNTTYTIVIKNGLKAGEYELEKSFKTTFSTYNRPENENPNTYIPGRTYKHSSITYDDINTFTPSEYPTFKLSSYTEEKIDKIKMYKFNSYNDFLKFLENENDYKVSDLGYQEFNQKDNKAEEKIYILNNTFDEGYYAEELYLASGEKYTTIPVQISNISAFLFTSDNDILVWVGSGTELLSGIEVSYGDKKVTTDEDGIAVIKDFNDNSGAIKYVKVGNSSNPLVIGVNNYDYIDYPSGYVYTDRPLYKNTDTISVWGYIPLKFYKEMFEDFKKQDFLIKLGEETMPVEINNDGTFEFKYELDNHVDGYENIEVSYKNVYIAGRGVSIENYSKENYEFDIEMDKRFVEAGQNIEFDVVVSHITGIKVQNKRIIANYRDRDYSAVTDSSGRAHFSIPTKFEERESSVRNEGIYINMGDSEYNENYSYAQFYIVNYNVDTSNEKYDAKTKTATFDVYNISAEKGNSNPTNSYYFDYSTLKTKDYSGTIEVELYETYEKKVPYTYYNSFTEETIETYRYERVHYKNVTADKINVTNGKLSYVISYDLKQNTDEDHYYYSLAFKIPYGGKTLTNTIYVDNAPTDPALINENGYLYYSDLTSGIWEDDYHYYRYYMSKEDKNNYSIDDVIKLVLKEYRGTEISDTGKVLRLVFKNKLLENKIFDKDDNLDSVFDAEAVPGVGYTGAFFLNGKFYRFPCYYFDYNEEDSKINIEVSTDKKEYSPGENVTIKIKTKDKNGNGIKSKVNLSVVDKGVFNIESDYNDILSSIYSNIYYHAYTFSTFRDYEIGITEGGGAGDANGGIRDDFTDTIYFDSVETDDNGEATIKFKLNDSVTTFTATFHAVNEDIYVGSTTKEIVSTLPLAISVLTPTGLKTSDDTIISANSIGTVKDKIKYTFEIEGTDKKIEKEAKVGETVYANFGKLEEGDYTVKVSAKSGNEKDAIKFPFSVKITQQEVAVKTISSIEDLKTIKPTRNPIVLEFYKKGFKKYIEYLDILLTTNEDRLDTRVAYYKALDYENKYYGTEYPIMINDMEKFNSNGVLRYLENGEDSPIVSALVHYYYPTMYNLTPDKFYERMDSAYDIDHVVDNLMVLAAMREPILDELNAIKKYDMTSVTKVKLGIAFAFAGDYSSAKAMYNIVKNDGGIDGELAILATFVDKENSAKRIDSLYSKETSNRYVYFAIMSYLLNNEAELSKESTITVSYSGKEETIKLKGLMLKKLTINNKDLATLTIKSNDENDMVNYYYEGGIDQIESNNIKKNIKISLDKNNLYVGQTVNLKVDLSNIKNITGNMKVYLPNCLRFSGDVSGTGAYLNANRGEYIIVHINKKHASTITIPLYITYPGNYKMEEVILKVDDNYYISNSIDVNVK